jgi:hypothetical protein
MSARLILKNRDDQCRRPIFCHPSSGTLLLLPRFPIALPPRAILPAPARNPPSPQSWGHFCSRELNWARHKCVVLLSRHRRIILVQGAGGGITITALLFRLESFDPCWLFSGLSSHRAPPSPPEALCARQLRLRTLDIRPWPAVE